MRSQAEPLVARPILFIIHPAGRRRARLAAGRAHQIDQTGAPAGPGETVRRRRRGRTLAWRWSVQKTGARTPVVRRAGRPAGQQHKGARAHAHWRVQATGPAAASRRARASCAKKCSRSPVSHSWRARSAQKCAPRCSCTHTVPQLVLARAAPAGGPAPAAVALRAGRRPEKKRGGGAPARTHAARAGRRANEAHKLGARAQRAPERAHTTRCWRRCACLWRRRVWPTRRARPGQRITSLCTAPACGSLRAITCAPLGWRRRAA